MALKIEQIERWFKRNKPGIRKMLKKWRNKKIRNFNKEEKPNIKYKGYEY